MSLAGTQPINGSVKIDPVSSNRVAGSSPVVDDLVRGVCDQLSKSHEKWLMSQAVTGAATGPSEGPALSRAARERRLQLLEALPIGELSGKVCVDFGISGRTFAGNFPALQRCGRPVQVDLTHEAVKPTAVVGRAPAHPCSRGDQLPLDDQSVDVFYAGEAIERVDNTVAFLDEVHRVLKPGGQFVLTTLNADSYLYRSQDETFGVSPDHRSLMGYAELRRYLDPRFEIIQANGYNCSISRSWDDKVHDLDFARAWTAQFADRPELTTGVVLLARKRAEYQPSRYQQTTYHHECPQVLYRGGPWEVIGLHGSMNGRVVSGGDKAEILVSFEGCGVILHFWSHPWSGEAVVEIDGVARSVNLYNAVSGFKRVHIDGLLEGQHQLRITGGRNLDPRSLGNQVIFYQALSYRKIDPSRPVKSKAGSDWEEGKPPLSTREIEELRRRVAGREWFHTIDLGHGIVTPGCDNSSAKLGYLNLPNRMDGMSVLDIGAYDGFFSFEAERRGAKRVVAADHFCWSYGGMATKDGFDIAKAALRSKVEDVFLPVEELAPATVGTFDLVYFLGVLYHAPDPLRYLRIVRSVCRGQVVLETEVDALDYPMPAAVFYPGKALNNDSSNFWGPNTLCVEAMLREAGFRQVQQICTFNMVHRPGRAFHRVVYHAFV